MEVIERTKRQCCEPQDLKPYEGKEHSYLRKHHLSSCVHCGQLWVKTWHRFDGSEWYTDWEKTEL